MVQQLGVAGPRNVCSPLGAHPLRHRRCSNPFTLEGVPAREGQARRDRLASVQRREKAGESRHIPCVVGCAVTRKWQVEVTSPLQGLSRRLGRTAPAAPPGGRTCSSPAGKGPAAALRAPGRGVPGAARRGQPFRRHLETAALWVFRVLWPGT